MSNSSFNHPPLGQITGQLRLELEAIKIPPRPAVMLIIEKEMRTKAPNFNSLEEIISIDVGISASLLKIANSAFFGFNGKARTVRDALQILGLNTVSTAIAALSLQKAFAHVPNLERFWDSSARIAQLSGWLVSELGSSQSTVRPEEAFTFGLFRDCGIPVLMSMYADYYEILKAANREEVRPFTAVEDEEMGLNHTLIGAALADEWQLPIELRAGIEFHHDAETIAGPSNYGVPDASRYFMALSQLAEYLFQNLSGKNETREWSKLGTVCSSVLGLTGDEDIDRLIEAARIKGIHTSPAI